MVALPPRVARVRRQFDRLARLSFGRMLDAALASRDVDAVQFMIWGGALLATPPLFFMVGATSRYPWLRFRSLELLQDAALADRFFFVIWSMLAALLLLSLFWEGVFPDRTDQQQLGVLPVSSRLVAGARVCTALVVGLTFLLAINLPAAVLYAVPAAVHPLVGTIPRIFVGHLVATVLAGMWVLATLLAVRGLLVCLVGARLAARAALVLQLTTVVLLVESFMFLPGLLGPLLTSLLQPGAAADTWLPPAWFLGVYSGISGVRGGILGITIPTALVATVISVVSAIAIYVVPAPWNARRVVEARESDRASLLGTWLVGLMTRVGWTRPQRALLAFTLASLVRSTRHLLIVATWFGAALAVAGTRLLSASVRGRPLPLDQPADYLVAIPLVLTFFLVAGMRSAFAVPTDLAANWVFRLTAARSPHACVHAARGTLWLLAVWPISLLTSVVGGTLWGGDAGLRIGVMHAVTGMLLAELAVSTCISIPFARGRGLSTASLRIGAPLALVGLHVFAFRLDDVQLAALSAPIGTLMYVGVCVAITLAVACLARRRATPPLPVFEAPSEAVVTPLSLSGATG
jgi:hypothetical protein